MFLCFADSHIEYVYGHSHAVPQLQTSQRMEYFGSPIHKLTPAVRSQVEFGM